ncbi:hypothetical protein Chor_002613 [Crotalus horridus]
MTAISLDSALHSPADQKQKKFTFALPAYCEWLILYTSHGFVYCDPLDSHEFPSSCPLDNWNRKCYSEEQHQRGNCQLRTSLKVALQRFFKVEQKGSLEEQQDGKEELS